MCDSPAEALSDIWDSVEDFGDNILDTVVPVALDFVTFGNGDEAWYSLSGEKYRDEKELEDKSKRIKNITNKIATIQDSLGKKVFLEQIFKYSEQRQIRGLGTSYEQLVAEYNELLNDYKKNQDGNFLASIGLFLPNVVSSYTYSLLDYIKTGDEASLRTAFSIAILVGVIVISVLSSPLTGGSSLSVTKASIIILANLITLDSMVNNSGLLGVAFRILDIVINKTLQLDKLLDTKGLDRDSDHYESTMNTVKLIVQVTAVAASLHSIYSSSITSGAKVASTAAPTAAETAINSISSYSIGGVSLSDLYQAYSSASNANDVYEATRLHSELQKKLAKQKEELEDSLYKANKRKMEASYSDAEYIMNQADMGYHSYVLQMSEAGQTDVFDPEGTIVMNTRYSPKRAFMFGFEDMFQYEGMAGGDLYVYNTLWK